MYVGFKDGPAAECRCRLWINSQYEACVICAYSPKISMLIPPEGRQTQVGFCLDNLSCMKAFGFEVADLVFRFF